MPEHGSRLKSFKNNGRGDLDDLRRRRTESSLELRKQKKDDQVLKKRNITIMTEDECTSDKTNAAQASTTPAPTMTLTEIIEVIKSSTANEQLFPAVQSIRKMLSRERNPPIDDVIKADLVKNLVSYLAIDDHPMLQFEAAWALTNIASGTSQQTRYVVDTGAVPHFINLLSSKNSSVCEQAVWALGNIAGDGSELREYVIRCGIVEPLLALVRPDTPNTFLRNITWTLSNLCRNKNPAPSMHILEKILPTLAQLLYFNDKEVLTDTCWALSYITDGTNENIDAVIRSGVVSRLIELLNMHNKSEVAILSPALRCIGNIVTGTDEQTQRVIDSGALTVFHDLLSHQKIGVQKEAAWTLSNITAGTKSQIQAVINANLVPLLVKVLANSELRVQKECAWALTNYTSGASTEQVLYLVQCQVMKPMCDLLSVKDPKFIKVLLDGLCNILLVAEKVGQLEQAKLYIEEIGGLNRIEELQEHENDDVYKLAYHMVEKFFSDEIVADESLQPIATSTQYDFNPPLQSSKADPNTNKFSF